MFTHKMFQRILMTQNKIFWRFSKVQQKNLYILSQFPYPSGDLHLGHGRVYIIGDCLVKYYKMKGYNVIYPMGWDAFGLPAQNAAIQNNEDPKNWTINNINRMRQQMKDLKIQFDWDRQFATCNPQYYKYTQLIFLKMFNSGLAYRGEGVVNWDPVDKTVLANQQVDEQGRSWRSGAVVQKKRLQQWFFKIRQYGFELTEDLNKLPLWVQQVKKMQKGWIGLEKGYFVEGKIICADESSLIGKNIQIFSTKMQNFMNPKNKIYLNQQGDQKIIGKIQVGNLQFQLKRLRQQVKQQGVYSIQSQENVQEGTNVSNQIQITQLSSLKYRTGQIMRLKDWLISRQRYWGTPIPIIYCKKCGVIGVPQNELPIILPQWQSNSKNPLLSDKFRNCKCPKCKGPSIRETDTMDTFVDSSWYFLRFLDSKNTQQIADLNLLKQMMPVDIYIGGMQHAIMHLLYARFVNKMLFKSGLTCTSQPFTQLIVQGLIKGKTYRIHSTGQYIKQQKVSSYEVNQIVQSYEKMSKSKFNGVNPSQILKIFSIDELRIALLFAAPPQSDIDFDHDLLVNARKFLFKIKQIVGYILGRQDSKQICIADYNIDSYTQEITEIMTKLDISIQKRYFHTYVANVMQLTNLLKHVIQRNEKKIEFYIKIANILLTVLYPLAPTLSNNLFEQMLQKGIKLKDLKKWPEIKSSTVEVLVKKGNKILRKQIIQSDLTDQQIKKILNISPQKCIEVKRLRKNILVLVQ